MCEKDLTSQIDWHSGFAGGLSLSMRDYISVIRIEREILLTKEPIRMDFLVVKKNEGVLIDNALGRGFRKYNIIEYKNPKDELDIDVIWKIIGYAGIYKSLGRTVDEIPANELTMTLVRARRPRKLLRYFESQNINVKVNQPGVYEIKGIINIPLRIVVLKEVTDIKLVPLKVMDYDADEGDIKAFLRESSKYSLPGDKQDADAVLQVSASANPDLFEKLKGDESMCEALKKLMADEINEAVDKAEKDGELRGEKRGGIRVLADLVKDGLLDINEAARRANMSVDKFLKEIEKV